MILSSSDYLKKGPKQSSWYDVFRLNLKGYNFNDLVVRETLVFNEEKIEINFLTYHCE